MAPTLKGLRGITVAIPGTATVTPLAGFSTLEAEAEDGIALGFTSSNTGTTVKSVSVRAFG